MNTSYPLNITLSLALMIIKKIKKLEDNDDYTDDEINIHIVNKYLPKIEKYLPEIRQQLPEITKYFLDYDVNKYKKNNIPHDTLNNEQFSNICHEYSKKIDDEYAIHKFKTKRKENDNQQEQSSHIITGIKFDEKDNSIEQNLLMNDWEKTSEIENRIKKIRLQLDRLFNNAKR